MGVSSKALAMASYAEPESPSLGLIACSTLMALKLSHRVLVYPAFSADKPTQPHQLGDRKDHEHPCSKPRKARGFDEAKNNPFAHEPFDHKQ